VQEKIEIFRYSGTPMVPNDVVKRGFQKHIAEKMTDKTQKVIRMHRVEQVWSNCLVFSTHHKFLGSVSTERRLWNKFQRNFVFKCFEGEGTRT